MVTLCFLTLPLTLTLTLTRQVWSFSVSYFRNQYAIIDQKATFGIGDDGHPHLGPDQGYETNPNPKPNPNPNPGPNPNPSPNPDLKQARDQPSK